MRKACLVVALVTATASAAPRVRVDLYSDRIYLQRERVEIARAVAEFLAHAGFDVVPEAELERLARVAREGRSLATDEVCGVPAPPNRLFEQELAEVQPAVAFVSCTSTCNLVVRVGDSDHWDAALTLYPTPAQVIAAAKHLRRHAPRAEKYAGLVGRDSGALGVALDVTMNGAWTTDPKRAIETQRAAIDACASDVRRDYVASNIVLEVDPSGAVAACESENTNALPPPGFDCLCQALGKVDFARGKAARRLRLDPWHQLAKRRRDNGTVATVEIRDLASKDPSVLWSNTGVSNHALAACIPGGLAIPSAWQTLPVQWHVASTGRVTLVRAAALGAPADVQHCFETVLRTATFACPQHGDVDVTATFSITELREP